MNKDVLIVILIAIIVTLTYFLFHPVAKTQRKLPQTVPPEQEISYVTEQGNENTVLSGNETVKSPLEPEFRINVNRRYNTTDRNNTEISYNNQNEQQLQTAQRNNPNTEKNVYRSSEQRTYSYGEPRQQNPIRIVPQTPIVKRERRSFEDNLSVCSPYKETMTTEYMGMKMNYSIEIVGWVKNKCVLNFESKMLDMGTTFEDTYGFEPGTVDVVGFAPKVRCEFTPKQLQSVGDSFLLEENTQNRKMLKDPKQIEIPDVKDMSLSDMKLLKILLSDRACEVVNANDFIQIFESLFSF